MDQLPTKVRPKKKYKTNRKDLDGGANPFELIKKGINNLSETLFPQTKQTFKTTIAVILQKARLIQKMDYFPLSFGNQMRITFRCEKVLQIFIFQ